MGTVDFDGRDAIAYWLRRDLNEANARVAALQGEREVANDLIAALQAELAALRPWAELGRRAVREHWYLATRDMLCCHRWYGDGHAPDCLLAQLEAADE